MEKSSGDDRPGLGAPYCAVDGLGYDGDKSFSPRWIYGNHDVRLLIDAKRPLAAHRYHPRIGVFPEHEITIYEYTPTPYTKFGSESVSITDVAFKSSMSPHSESRMATINTHGVLFLADATALVLSDPSRCDSTAGGHRNFSAPLIPVRRRQADQNVPPATIQP